MKEGKIRSVILQKDRSTLLEVDSDAAAKWFANAINSVEFSSRLGDDVAFRTRIYNTLALNVPLNIDLRDEKHREEINKVNNLEENTIAAIQWAKPMNRRSQHQKSAHLVLSFTNPEAANQAITNSIIICNKKCYVE